MRVEEALALYTAQLAANGRSVHTIRQAERHIRELARWAAQERVGEEIEGWVAAFLAQLLNAARALPGASGAKRSESTLNAFRSSLRGFFGYLHRAGYIYYLTDDQYNATALTNASGTPMERYEYDDYGAPSFFDGAGNCRHATVLGNPYLFTGREYEFENGLYWFRSRYLDPASGRFASRDRIGAWGDQSNCGSAVAYVNSSPWSALDPLWLTELERLKKYKF